MNPIVGDGVHDVPHTHGNVNWVQRHAAGDTAGVIIFTKITLLC